MNVDKVEAQERRRESVREILLDVEAAVGLKLVIPFLSKPLDKWLA